MFIVKLVVLVTAPSRGDVPNVAEVLHVTLSGLLYAALGVIIILLDVDNTAVVFTTQVPALAVALQAIIPLAAAAHVTTLGFAAVPLAAHFVLVSRVRVRVVPP